MIFLDANSTCDLQAHAGYLLLAVHLGDAMICVALCS